MEHLLYTYRPLESSSWIRVVQLLPSTNASDPLYCHIIHLDRRTLFISTDLQRNYYHAVSYVWGKPEFSHDLLVLDEMDSEAQAKIIKVTPAADTVLRRFRKATKSLNLWIDGVSLNQADQVEVARQIPLMGEIFSESAKVRIWLGGEDDGVGEVFAMIRLFAHLLKTTPSARVVDVAAQKLHENFHDHAYALLGAFLNRSWFTRRWVLQEYALSRVAILYAHDHKIFHQVMVDGLNLVQRCLQSVKYQGASGVSSSARQALRVAANLSRTSRPLLENLWNYHTTQCSDARDAVRALIGFSVEKDHSKSIYGSIDLNSMDIFQELACRYVRAGLREHILHHALTFRGPSSVSEGRPSWIPDWSRNRLTQGFLPLSPSPSLWQGSKRNDIGDSTLQLGLSGVSRDGQVLFLRETTVQIARVAAPMTTVTNWASVLEHTRLLLDRKLSAEDLGRFSFALVSVVAWTRSGPIVSEKQTDKAFMGSMLCLHLCKLAGLQPPYRLTLDGSESRKDLRPLLSELLDRAGEPLTVYSSFASEPFDIAWPKAFDVIQTIHSPVVGFGFGGQDMLPGDLILRHYMSSSLQDRYSKPEPRKLHLRLLERVPRSDVKTESVSRSDGKTERTFRLSSVFDVFGNKERAKSTAKSVPNTVIGMHPKIKRDKWTSLGLPKEL
jgi:hypothetical protein